MMNQPQEPLLLADTDLETITGGAPINYGDFAGSTVMYLDVTETASSPRDFFPFGSHFTGGVSVS